MLPQLLTTFPGLRPADLDEMSLDEIGVCLDFMRKHAKAVKEVEGA